MVVLYSQPLLYISLPKLWTEIASRLSARSLLFVISVFSWAIVSILALPAKANNDNVSNTASHCVLRMLATGTPRCLHRQIAPRW